jgi:hypothetical protein
MTLAWGTVVFVVTAVFAVLGTRALSLAGLDVLGAIYHRHTPSITH